MPLSRWFRPPLRTLTGFVALVAGLLMLSGGLSLAHGLTATATADEAGSGRTVDTVSALTTDSRAGSAGHFIPIEPNHRAVPGRRPPRNAWL